MATDHSTVAPTNARFATRRVAMDGTAGNATEVTTPDWPDKVTVTFTQSDASADTGKIAEAGTDTSAIGNDHFPVASGGAYEWNLGPGGGRLIYLAGGTNSGFAHVMYEVGE